MGTLGGQAQAKGELDLSREVPAVNMEGKITGVTGTAFMKSVGAKTSLVEGQGIILVNLAAEGERREELIASLNGDARVYSKNGVIKRWNMFAKIFRLLNVYDLFKGKVPTTEGGLEYRKMGATFKVKKGVFSTQDFLIDTPSMLITAVGNIDVTKEGGPGDHKCFTPCDHRPDDR